MSDDKKLLSEEEKKVIRWKLLEVQDDLTQPIVRRVAAGMVRFLIGLDTPRDLAKRDD